MGAILAEVAASLCLKSALVQPAFYAVVVTGYVLAFGLLSIALRQGLPLGVGYGIWGACGVALTAVMSFVLFDEPLTIAMGMGIVLIMGGVLLVEIGSQTAAKSEGQQERA